MQCEVKSLTGDEILRVAGVDGMQTYVGVERVRIERRVVNVCFFMYNCLSNAHSIHWNTAVC